MKKIINWLGQNLLHHSSVGAYFETVIQAVKPSWRTGYYRTHVHSMSELAKGVVSLWLVVDDKWPIHDAGQHIELTIEINGKLTTRVFTIASAPEIARTKQLINLVIKTQSNGQLTPILHQLPPGVWLNISAPMGEFTVDKLENDTLLLAAGSGITPFASILSHLRHTKQSEKKFHLIYYAKPNEHLLVAELKQYQSMSDNFSFELKSRSIDGGITPYLAPYHNSRFLVCGPAPFYQDITDFTDVHGNELFSEHFALQPTTFVDKAQFNVLFKGKTFELDNTAPILNQLIEHGEQVRYGCKMGICHQCQCIKTQGVVKNLLTGNLSDNGEELIQLCTSQLMTDLELKA